MVLEMYEDTILFVYLQCIHLNADSKTKPRCSMLTALHRSSPSTCHLVSYLGSLSCFWQDTICSGLLMDKLLPSMCLDCLCGVVLKK